MELRTPLARARGLGAAHQGSRTWWRQRVTALTLIPLGLWFAFAIAHLPGAEFATIVSWIAKPWNSILLMSFTVTVFFHAMLGLQVIIEDYAHPDWMKIAAILSAKLLLGFLTVAALFAILRIAFAG